MLQFPTPAPLTESQNSKALKLMDRLDFVSKRNEGHYTAKRTTLRQMFRQRVTVYVPDGFTEFGSRIVQYSFEAWARNLSPAGISLLYPGELKFEQGIVCLCPQAEDKRCIHIVMRCSRRASPDFWEFGMEFDGTVSDDPSTLAG